MAGRYITSEEYWELFLHNTRLSAPYTTRTEVAVAASFALGMGLGVSLGGRNTALQFRAENAHRLPNTTTGWYLYHKSKGYAAIKGGISEGLKMGTKLGVMAAFFFTTENVLDVWLGNQTMFSTMGASLTTAGAFSLVTRLAAPQAARTIWTSLRWGFVYGGVQDFISLARGQPVAYVEYVRRHLGKRTKAVEKEAV